MGMMLHCGANIATREEVALVETPENTDTWFPIPHTALLDAVGTAIETSGFQIVKEEFGLWDSAPSTGGLPGARMFGLLTLENGEAHDDYALVVGLRNAHDKLFSASLAAGSDCFI